MTPAAKYTAGQVVWLVLSRRCGGGCPATILKIARKWATLDYGGYRFDVATGCVDGGRYSSPGSVYESREAHELETLADNRWRELASYVQRRKPTVTLEALTEARRLLGMGEP